MRGHWFIVVHAYTNHKVSYMYMFEAGMHNGGHAVTEVEVGNTHAQWRIQKNEKGGSQ